MSYDTVKAALLVQLGTLFPAESYPVENALYTELITEFCTASEAKAALTARPMSSYSAAGVSLSYRDAGAASRTTASTGVQLARAGFSLNMGTPVVHDIRGHNEPIS